MKGDTSSDHESLDTGVNLEGRPLTTRISLPFANKTPFNNALSRDRGHHPRLITAFLSSRQL